MYRRCFASEGPTMPPRPRQCANTLLDIPRQAPARAERYATCFEGQDTVVVAQPSESTAAVLQRVLDTVADIRATFVGAHSNGALTASPMSVRASSQTSDTSRNTYAARSDSAWTGWPTRSATRTAIQKCRRLSS